MDSYIGWWARRIGPWHLVQSEIADRVVLKCGREMRLETGRGKLTFLLEPSRDRCLQCSPESR